MLLKVADLFRVDGKIAVITGGSAGIGRMIASVFCTNGVRVYIVGRKLDALDAAAQELSSLGECIPLAADVSDPAGIEQLAATLREREEGIDILVNNAGRSWAAPIETFPMDAWDKVCDLNVRTPFLLTRALLPLLEARATDEDFSRVINLSSVGARMIAKGASFPYGASKAGLEQLTRMLAYDLGSRRITVNCIAPGWFPTRMNAVLGDAAAEDWRRKTPVGRLGDAADIGGLAIFLCSRAGMFIDGQIIDSDGGRMLTRD